MWIQTPDIATSYEFLVRWRNYGYQLYATNTSIGLTGWSDSNPADNWSFQGQGPINDGAWHCVVATSSSTATAIYIDGRQVESGPGIAGTYFPYGFQYAVAMDGDACYGVNSSFPGQIADVAVYAHPLTAADVAAHYAAAGHSSAAPQANVVFVHGINGNFRGLENAAQGTDPQNKNWLGLMHPLNGSTQLTIFPYYQDVGYSPSGQANQNCDPTMPGPVTDSSSNLYLDPNSAPFVGVESPSYCDSQSALALNGVQRGLAGRCRLDTVRWAVRPPRGRRVHWRIRGRGSQQG